MGDRSLEDRLRQLAKITQYDEDEAAMLVAADALAECRRLVEAIEAMEGVRISISVKMALKSARAKLKGEDEHGTDV